MKPIAHYLETKGITVDDLVTSTGLDVKVIQAIVTGNYTPSPSERKRLAAALDVPIEEIAWGHAVPVEHMWGHGPQFGRTP